jgi:hypothetical protein
MRALIFLMATIGVTALLGEAFQTKNSRVRRTGPMYKMCIDRTVSQELIDVSKTPDGIKQDSDNSWRTQPSNIVPINIPKFEGKPALITFDATDTLIELSQSVGRWYREILNEASEMRIRLPRPALFTAAFENAYADM